MKTIKKIALSLGLGPRYFDHWWQYRCPFEPLEETQISKGFYFVHIPKTAGTSVLRALDVGQTPYTHCPAHIIHQKHPEVARILHFFTVVRDPFDRFASSFEYITKRSDWPAQRRFAKDVIADMSFLEFTKKLAQNRAYRNLVTGYEFFFPQSFFTHRNGKPLVQDVLRFETITEDFNRVIQSGFAGVSKPPTLPTLPSLRDHGGGDYKSMYDPRSADLIRQLYAEDFRNFGYCDALKLGLTGQQQHPERL